MGEHLCFNTPLMFCLTTGPETMKQPTMDWNLLSGILSQQWKADWHSSVTFKFFCVMLLPKGSDASHHLAFVPFSPQGTVAFLRGVSVFPHGDSVAISLLTRKTSLYAFYFLIGFLRHRCQKLEKRDNPWGAGFQVDTLCVESNAILMITAVDAAQGTLHRLSPPLPPAMTQFYWLICPKMSADMSLASLTPDFWLGSASPGRHWLGVREQKGREVGAFIPALSLRCAVGWPHPLSEGDSSHLVPFPHGSLCLWAPSTPPSSWPSSHGVEMEFSFPASSTEPSLILPHTLPTAFINVPVQVHFISHLDWAKECLDSW
jgi:hypothetical protein